MEGINRFSDAARTPIWLETIPKTDVVSPLTADIHCDLAVIGGGFTGLWAALKARERWPDAQIVILEATRCGAAASGRNGGFCAPSISHGVTNALSRWPEEAETLIRLGYENLDGLQEDLTRYGIDCEFEREGKLNVAATPWQAEGLKAMHDVLARFGIESRYIEGDALNEKFKSPKYHAGLYEPNYALVNPMKLVAGLQQACLDRGIVLYEDTPVTSLDNASSGVGLTTPKAVVSAKQAVMATNAAIPLLKRFRMSIIPIFDYTLVTEPLSNQQLMAIGWRGRYGIADSGNQFHYCRKTADNRILWGGFDAIYHYGSRRDQELLHRPESYARLAANFAEVFPALSNLSFTHAWGGIVDTSARTTFFAGTALRGRLAYALGFTGQGVSASRFAALAMLDMLEGKRTERTDLRMLRSWVVPFPPEPFRSLAIKHVQKDLAQEDLTGYRSLLLRTLNRFGVGFDS